MSSPTEKQTSYLLSLGAGAAIVCGKRRETDVYLRRGWVTAEDTESNSYPYKFIRITAEGLRALADGIEAFGLPDLGRKPRTTIRVCSDCDSTRFRFETIDADAYVPSRMPRRRAAS